MEIEYKIGQQVSCEQFLTLLNESTLGERRPVDDLTVMQGMLENSNLMVTAWHGDTLVGIARSVTDFHYACYLSDLAVSLNHQQKGIGKQLQRLTQCQLGPKCKLILIAAPKADAYYQHIGFSSNSRCYVLERDQQVR